MKIFIDLQCCQTEAQSRGIGRYSSALAEAIVRLAPQHDYLFLLNFKYLKTSRTVVDLIHRLGGHGNIVFHDYPAVTYGHEERMLRDMVANVLRNDRIASSSPDIYHISSLFEGESIYGVAASYLNLPGADVLCSGTLYDLIPGLYPDKYLTQWPVVNWWKRTTSVARRLDIGLAISDATKEDAERLLGIEPNRVTNISGSVSDIFRELPAEERYTGKIWNKIDRERPFILYVGGDDFRKNLRGTLESFAIASRALDHKYDLVIVYNVQAAEAAAIMQQAHTLGVGQKVKLTGFVSDDELVQLYNACTLFIFPSLYEGLGLPVIEAMRCGAPVIVGDNSSLIEIVPEREFRFDASDFADIARVMERVLTQAGTLDRMRAYGRKRAACFSWENSARRALDAWEEAHDRRTLEKSTRTVARKPRIAMFTPLPPQQTGIAAYSVDLIASVVKYADLDLFVEDITGLNPLPVAAAVRHHSAFPFVADDYDAVVYQLGNSPFHHYILPYCRKFPGVVVIHDAYLGHLSHDPGNPNAFVRQVIRDHGGPARAIVRESESTQAAVRKIIERLTCSRTHVHNSIGVVVHSEFARSLLSADADLATAPRITVLHQQRKIDERDRAARLAARKKLGLDPDELVVCTFGHVAATKGILELIEAFRSSNVKKTSRARLVFVGELEGGATHDTPYARSVLEAIGDDPQFTITGFVDDEVYDLHLAAVDIGVQLRTVTRGETSRAVLDLLANGAPLIYNRLGWTTELPAEIALGLETWEPSAIRDAIDALARDGGLRKKYAEAAIRYARETLDPDVVAAAFVRTVLDATARARRCGPGRVSRDTARLLSNSPSSSEFLTEIGTAYVNQERSELAPRLLIDVSHIRENDLRTGVQRVVRELTRAAYASPIPALNAQTFAYSDRGLLYADDFAVASGARLEAEGLGGTRPLQLRPLDRILMADGTWHLVHQMREPLARLDALGGSAFGLVHDLLPIQHPELFHDHVRESILGWLKLLLESGRGLFCTSKTGADAVVSAVEELHLPVRAGLRVGYAKLGANFSDYEKGAGELSPDTAAVSKRRDMFLMVGTIEPRKGHACVLDAFDALWSEGVDATLVFAGKRGWQIDELMSRIEEHPERNKRFFYLDFVPDQDLKCLCQNATAAIIASIAEGFGLPIYEAAFFGTPLLLSDLDVFKEIAGDDAGYFPAGSASALAAAVREVLKTGAKSSCGIATPTWSEFSTRVFEFMAGEHTYHTFGG